MSEFNGTPHISAKKGEIAKTVIMPGDPLRAKFVADHYLQDLKLFNNVRGMLGFTGNYKGKTVSIMGHGMGMPSMGIYSYELFNFYDVENIIRVGSCGAYRADLDLFDVILTEASYSRSNFAKVTFGYDEDLLYPDKELTAKLEENAKRMNKKIVKGIVISGDSFYRDRSLEVPAPYPIVAGEMESFALFANARYLHKKAACLLTVSDLKDKIATPKERETAFMEMIEIALQTAIELE